mmetsp:Transcript_4195/g.12017  ORF Transcript_4195/g.12017 Transcript_4195/m.12017 type:complete len:255 (-) Transcript_4195:2963-3727(-)
MGRCRLHGVLDAHEHEGLFDARKHAPQGPQVLRLSGKNDERDSHRNSHHQVLRLGATLWQGGGSGPCQGNGRPHQNVLRCRGRLFHHLAVHSDHPAHHCVFDVRQHPGPAAHGGHRLYDRCTVQPDAVPLCLHAHGIVAIHPVQDFPQASGALSGAAGAQPLRARRGTPGGRRAGDPQEPQGGNEARRRSLEPPESGKHHHPGRLLWMGRPRRSRHRAGPGGTALQEEGTRRATGLPTRQPPQVQRLGHHCRRG